MNKYVKLYKKLNEKKDKPIKFFLSVFWDEYLVSDSERFIFAVICVGVIAGLIVLILKTINYFI
jgi:hypothetical protein